MSKIKVILLVTSNSKFGSYDKVTTGWYLPEVAHPWKKFLEQGYELTFASPKGGAAPGDPDGIKQWAKDKVCSEFSKKYLKGQNIETVKMSTLKVEEYDVLFYCGGTGVMWDFPDDEFNNNAGKIIYEKGGIIGAVCHGPAGIVNIKLSNGKYLIEGKHVTGFSNEEEYATKLEKYVPFLLETKLKERGALYSSKKVWDCNVCIDGRLITGQNPKSADKCADEIIKLIKKGVLNKNKEEKEQETFMQQIEFKIKGKLDELLKVYKQNVFKYLTSQKGCLDAFVTVDEDKKTFKVIYHWVSKEDFTEKTSPEKNKELTKIIGMIKQFADGKPLSTKWNVKHSYKK